MKNVFCNGISSSSFYDRHIGSGNTELSPGKHSPAKLSPEKLAHTILTRSKVKGKGWGHMRQPVIIVFLDVKNPGVLPTNSPHF